MHTLITAAAWIAALATVLWQRLLRPLLQLALPELASLLSDGPTTITSRLESHGSQTLVVAAPAPQPAPRRRGRPRRSQTLATL
jgi:hypothetical protein